MKFLLCFSKQNFLIFGFFVEENHFLPQKNQIWCRTGIHRWLRLWHFLETLKANYRKNLVNISNFQLLVFFHWRHKMKYYQDSSVILFAYLVFGLKKASLRISTKVKVEQAGFSQQITGKYSDTSYSLSGAASVVVVVVFIMRITDKCNWKKFI